eukprot:CAMPEP_0204915700 /NCGR_PEP_ID=MMETSP1397-20131031/13669_1 /ASSEMBLY_ACC=CAM_ASM_000891 /TAXON_ID=49980 /ORGANISM="Climacostomum Climacostomum virens, Strain Stock W-24" /LENGTH=133 /DNA_ID=CAMNT_0052087877 /DNA_START=22 /DNA_END=423 /DNA_ORIENTATION=-
MKFLKPGKVVIVTSGRYAGRKAVIVQNTDSKSKERPYGHSLVAGMKKYPKKVIRGMSKRTIARRSQVSVFLRVVNQKHFLPTRYNMDLSKELRGKINVSDATKKAAAKKLVKKVFQARYNTGSNRWFFQRLRF